MRYTEDVLMPLVAQCLPLACMCSSGRVFSLSMILSVCPPLFGLFVHSVHFQGLIIHLTDRSGEKSSLYSVGGQRLTEMA